MATNTVLHKKTAMEENQKAQILAQEMVRRMLNTNDMVDKKTRLEVVDNMAKKLRTSGYSVKQTRKIISNGLKKYEAKKARCRVEGKPLYRTAKTSLAKRYKKKLLAKSSWFKGRKNAAKLSHGKQYRKKGNAKSSCQNLETKTVIFVEYTPGGSWPSG